MRVRIVSNLPVDRDLHTSGAMHISRIDPEHSALIVCDNDGVLVGGPLGRVRFGAHIVKGVGVRGLRGAGGDARAGGDDVRRAGGAGRRGRARECEGAAVVECPADGQDDTEGHGGC